MFLFGFGGSILPYVISIIAIWSGIWLGHAHLFQVEKHGKSEYSINIENDTWLETHSSNTFHIDQQGEFNVISKSETTFLAYHLSCFEVRWFPDFKNITLTYFKQVNKLRGSPATC